MKTVTDRTDEFSIIAKYFAPLAGDGTFGLTDDAALFSTDDTVDCVITQDAIAEGIHFLPEDLPADIARKALRTNLSDLAAKGARPLKFSLAFGLPNNWQEDWIAGFAQGLAEDSQKYGIALTGGDTFSTGANTVISITAIGEVPKGRYRTRSGGQVGDQVYVTGTIGDAALGLLSRTGKLELADELQKRHLENRYLLPQPRCGLAAAVSQYASASMDVSDGFAADLDKLCKASGLLCDVRSNDVPLSEEANEIVSRIPDMMMTVLGGGDDYELVVTIPEENQEQFEEAADNSRIPVTPVGMLEEGPPGLQLTGPDGNQIIAADAGYNHLAR